MSFTLTQLTTTLGNYNRERPGQFIQKVFNRLQTLDHVTVVPVKDELPLTTIGGADLTRPNLRDNAWNPVSGSVNFSPRILKVRPGKADIELVPAQLWATWLGHQARAGASDQLAMPFEEFIMDYLAGKVADELQMNTIWKGQYNAGGSTPATIADGFEKIIEDSITAAGAFDVPAAQVTDVGVISASNAYDQALTVARTLPDALRQMESKMFMSWQTSDFYNDDYAGTIGANPYNSSFDKMRIHGTNAEIVKTSGMTDGKFLNATMDNLFVGMDLESDINQINFQQNRRGIDVMIDFSIGMQVADPRNIAYGYDAA